MSILGWRYGKGQGTDKVMWIQPLGTMNMFTKSHPHPSASFPCIKTCISNDNLGHYRL